jgi:hypothetical protein
MPVAKGEKEPLQVLGRDEAVLVCVEEPPRLVDVRILLVREGHKRHAPVGLHAIAKKDSLD